jgi:ABC-type amino acid transport substrate-binding protein
VRAAFRDVTDRDAFNAGLKTIRANGSYDKVFVRYGLANPDKKEAAEETSAAGMGHRQP